jgi:transcriptional regulator with XRE-family HTH domain
VLRPDHDQRETPRVPKKKERTPPPELLSLGTRLRYARERQRLTAAAVAESAQIDPGQLSRYENGERTGGIEVATVIALARALGVPVGWLAADEGALPPVAVFREKSDRRRKASKS